MSNDLPPVNHAQGFRSADEIREYLAPFADRPDTDIAFSDLFGRQTTFGDLRKLAGPKERQESMLLPFESHEEDLCDEANESSQLGRS